MGDFDYETVSYPEINRENIAHSLRVLQLIIDRYKGHPAVMGLEPVNEVRFQGFVRLLRAG